ncbi:hypothetical protein D9M71_771470 [compost metagenome]
MRLPRRVATTDLTTPFWPLKAPRNEALNPVKSDWPKNFSTSRRTPLVRKLASSFSIPMSSSTAASMPPARYSSVLRVNLGRVRLGTSPWRLMPSTNRLVL